MSKLKLTFAQQEIINFKSGLAKAEALGFAPYIHHYKRIIENLNGIIALDKTFKLKL